ncbi:MULTISPECIES: hypothetical protein [unclassified Streptomyces]|uniref:hypothetical protein n=1 Tax=unclassified Streptomyces TaxID=2593676 RepID=UPI002E35A866|nr:hypothetical protein [Streptomyces sp. NBC_01280]
MSREQLIVCMDASAATDINQAISAAMAPFDRNRDLSSDQDKGGEEWDSWDVGSTKLEFLVRVGHENDPRLVRNPKTPRGELRPLTPGLCDGGPLGLLDLREQKLQAAAAAQKLWNQWTEFSQGFPTAQGLDDLIAADPHASEQVPGPAWHAYRRQPLVQALFADHDLRDRFGDNAVGNFGVGEDAFIHRKANESVTADALLTIDGRWLAWDSMRHDPYVQPVGDYLDRLPQNAIAVVVTYHC